MLMALDNEVIFKKAFTNKEVFIAFVKDILGLDVEVEKIETEKAFIPKVGNIAFKYDVFAETTDQRVIIEIQKVDYDYNFDRFLHYHLQGITEQQTSSRDYIVKRTVYTIVIFTTPYTTKDKQGHPVKDEFLLSALNPKNLAGAERELYGHQLIFLNPHYRNADTPPNIKDWLDLIHESIHHPAHPNINLAKPAIKKVSELIDYDDMTSEEITASKIAEARKITLAMHEEKGRVEGRHEEKLNIARNLLTLGLDTEKIAAATGLSEAEVTQLRDEE